MTALTVIVPTYRRPQDLMRCLEALKAQTRPADEVIVTVRDIDTDTWEALERYNAAPLPIRIATVTVTGVIAAMNLALEQSTGDIVSFTDDDAAPFPDWLARIEAHFDADASLGGVGGKDWMHYNGRLIEGQHSVVGRVQWFGRAISNHHIGVGAPRYVDVLKGVNMSFRRKAMGDRHFDTRLLGTGAQVHFEIAYCLALKNDGWNLLYDPEIAVNHYLGQRFDEDRRQQFDEIAFYNEVHNHTVALLDNFSASRRLAFATWAILVGSRRGFGFVQWLRFFPSQGQLASQKWRASMRGRWQGFQTWKTKQAPSGNGPTLSSPPTAQPTSS